MTKEMCVGFLGGLSSFLPGQLFYDFQCCCNDKINIYLIQSIKKVPVVVNIDSILNK